MTCSVRIHEFGGADVLKIEDAAVREPGPGQVRLRIHAVGLNRTEVTLRSGRSPVKHLLPCSAGFEAAQVIEALGPDVSAFAVGDRVALVPAYSALQYTLYGEVSLAPAASSSVGLAAIHGRGARPSQSRHCGKVEDNLPDRAAYLGRGWTACVALTRGLAVHPGALCL
jgi:NADPH:quinone reductase-like Zn-dependent oxidoreductase